MNPEETFERLVAADILTPTAGDDAVALTETFRDAVDHQVSEITSQGVSFDNPSRLEETITELVDRDTHLAAIGSVLNRFVDELDFDEFLGMLIAVSQLQVGVDSSEGIPASFIPIPCALTPTIVPALDRGIIYVWREDCDPCDTMRMEFDSIFEKPPEDTALCAVYGPQDGELLYEEFNVVGAPTTLFVRGGKIDSRLVGAHYRNVIEREIDMLHDP